MTKRAKNELPESRVVIYTRIKSETVDALDEIRKALPFTPTRAQVIDVALAEYVGKHVKKLRESPPSNK
jgi:hypothetical protein